MGPWGGGVGGRGIMCVISLSCVVLQQCFGGYISGKLLMVVFRRKGQLLRLSGGVAGEKYGVMQHCKRN